MIRENNGTQVNKQIVYVIDHHTFFYPERNVLMNSNGGSIQKLEPLLSKILSYFIENSSRPVTREELQNTFWNSHVFSDQALTKAISKIRKLLPQNSIATLNKVGYEWAAPVKNMNTSKVSGILLKSKKVISQKSRIWTLILIIIILIMIKGLCFPHH